MPKNKERPIKIDNSKKVIFGGLLAAVANRLRPPTESSVTPPTKSSVAPPAESSASLKATRDYYEAAAKADEEDWGV